MNADLVTRVEELESDNAELRRRIAKALDEVSRLECAGFSYASVVRYALQGKP